MNLVLVSSAYFGFMNSATLWEWVTYDTFGFSEGLEVFLHMDHEWVDVARIFAVTTFIHLFSSTFFE